MEVRAVVRGMHKPGAAGRAALAAAAAGAVVMLAACGSQAAGGPPGPVGGMGAAPVPGGRAVAGVALCKDIPRLTRVVVSRTAAFRAFEPGLILPRGFTIGEPRLVRGLAAALCGLPAMPRGLVSCPAQFRGSLRMAFTAGGRPFLPVTVQVSGCRVVTGLGPARSARSAAFWRTVGEDLGLSSPQGTSQSGGINP
jgi:hypothetical protein